MQILTADSSYAMDFVNIYNSAIKLFPKSQRSDATPDIFNSVFKKEKAFIAVIDDKSVGFASYRLTDKNVVELGSLYVALEEQGKGIGKKLLEFVESQVNSGWYLYAKVLSNAPWSVSFYSKNGFVKATDMDCVMLGTKQNSWEMVYYKKLV